MIDKIQIMVLSAPTKLAGGVLLTALLAMVIDPIFGAIGLVVLSVALGFLSTWYWFQRNAAVKERDHLAVEHQKLVDRVTEIEMQSHVLAQAMLPVSAAFQAILIKELTHMHTPEMDGLLVKLGPPFILTEPEADRLNALINERTRDMGAEFTASERDAATMMPALIRRVRAESEELKKTKRSLKLVSMMAVVETPDGNRKAMLISTKQSADGLELDHLEREALAVAIAENTQLTREANDAARSLLRLPDRRAKL